MSWLKPIVGVFNDRLKVKVFGDKRFASAEYNAIAYQVITDNRDTAKKVAPCIPGKSAEEYTPMMFDDTKAFVLYHKIITSSYEPYNGGPVFGRKSGMNIKGNAIMQMIILANRNTVRILPEEFESLVIVNFPQGTEAEFVSINPQLNGILTTPKSSDLDYAKLWAQEYKGYDFNVNPDRMILSVNYTIESIFKTGCFSLCDCQGEEPQQ